MSLDSVGIAASSWTDPAAVLRAAEVLGARARLHAPLGALTTSRVGGPAAIAYLARDTSDVARAGEAAAASGLEVLVVGRGSNLLVADRGFEGIALMLGDAYGRIDIDPANSTVSAGAGVALPVLARRCAAAGVGGLEWAVGVPGSVGGAVRMNAGGHGSDMASCLIDVDIVDLGIGRATRADASSGCLSAEQRPRTVAACQRAPRRVDVGALDLGYRSSGLRSGEVVVGARLSGTRVRPAAAMDQIADIVRWRRQHQPGGQNAGSVFMNPPGESAGARIDQAGLRGLRVGSAQVSSLHANFIVSDPGGTAADVVALMAEVQRRVHESAGIMLRPEIRMVGFETAPIPS